MVQLDIGPKPVDPTGTTSFDTFELIPAGRSIGADVNGIDLSNLSDAAFSELRRAFLDWKVLFFRNQDLSRQQHREFAQRWGEIEVHPFFKFVHQQDDADVVRLAKDESMSGFENEWHNDVTWSAQPSYGAVLRAIEVPAFGGDTIWSDTAAAFDGLPTQVRERVKDLRARHSWHRTFGQAMTEEQFAQLDSEVPPADHPVVITHPETGRRHLFVNRYFTDHIVDVDPHESTELLECIYHQVARPEYHVRHQWMVGDVAFWDNRACQHYAVSDYAPQRRVMDRISIAGTAL